MKKVLEALPKELTLLVVIAELIRSHSAVLHTGRNENSAQDSHPGADFTAFPTIILTVEKAKNHFFGSGGIPPYLIVRNERLTEREFFVRVEGHVEERKDRDERMLTVTFRADTVQLKKDGSLSTKETWHKDLFDVSDDAAA